MPFRVLITGSRNWIWREPIHSALNRLHQLHRNNLVVVHGACPRGADNIADLWCRLHQAQVERYAADWTLGRHAGFLRNAAMVNSGPRLCLAFIRANSAGATHCADLADKAGIPVARHTR